MEKNSYYIKETNDSQILDPTKLDKFESIKKWNKAENFEFIKKGNFKDYFL